jgi:hypothetical protein
MPARLNRRVLFRLAFPVTGWVAVALFVFAFSGLPIPVPYAKDVSRPFPCMFGQCGCRDADQCWRSCCCHTAAERVAWARQHEVKAPAFLLAAADAEQKQDQRAAAGCCQRPSMPPACETAACQAKSCSDDSACHASLSLIAALKCRGAGEFVAGVPICLPPARLDWRPADLCFAPPAAALATATSAVHAPPVPPPRTHAC